MDLSFYKNKRVLLTGHTGFKGAWMSQVLVGAGAELTGYSRGSEKEYSLFELAGLKDKLRHVAGDVRDLEHLKRVFAETRPEANALHEVNSGSYANLIPLPALTPLCRESDRSTRVTGPSQRPTIFL